MYYVIDGSGYYDDMSDSLTDSSLATPSPTPAPSPLPSPARHVHHTPAIVPVSSSSARPSSSSSPSGRHGGAVAPKVFIAGADGRLTRDRTSRTTPSLSGSVTSHGDHHRAPRLAHDVANNFKRNRERQQARDHTTAAVHINMLSTCTCGPDR